MNYETLEIERADHIATVRFNRPQKLNALNRQLMLDITRLALELREDTDTRVVVFTGNGKHFSAGADLSGDGPGNSGLRTRLGLRRGVRIGPDMIRALYEIDQITIAAVNGVALGGGACIATACDFRVAATDARCGYPEVNRGMNLQWVALPLCVHLIGPSRAKRMIGLGRNEEAQTLLQWGFFDELAEPERLVDCAMEMARSYAQQPPIAVQMIKQSVNAVVSALDRSIMHMDHDQWMLTATTDDYREGIRAFFEKRSPNFEGN